AGRVSAAISATHAISPRCRVGAWPSPGISSATTSPSGYLSPAALADPAVASSVLRRGRGAQPGPGNLTELSSLQLTKLATLVLTWAAGHQSDSSRPGRAAVFAERCDEARGLVRTRPICGRGPSGCLCGGGGRSCRPARPAGR